MLREMADNALTERRSSSDPEYRTLRCLACATAEGIPERPLDALQQAADLACELTGARFAAVTITDGGENVKEVVVSGLALGEEPLFKAASQGHGLLNPMRQEGPPVSVGAAEHDESAFGLPYPHPEVNTLLGVPLRLDGTVRGGLYVANRDGGKPFRDEDEVVLDVLARHVTSIIAAWN